MTFHILSHVNLESKSFYRTCFHLLCYKFTLRQISLLKVPITRLITRDRSNGPFVYTLLSYEVDWYLSDICQKSFSKGLIPPLPYDIILISCSFLEEDRPFIGKELLKNHTRLA